MKIICSRDRLRPDGSSSHRSVDLCSVGEEAMLVDQIACELGETVTVVVTVKHWAKEDPERATSVGERTACAVLQADVHHAAQEQTQQMGVDKISRLEQGREETHSGLQFRIGHQRQVDQAVDLALRQVAPDRLILRLNLLLGRVCREVDAEQAQTRENAVDGLRVLGPHDMKLELQMAGGRLVNF